MAEDFSSLGKLVEEETTNDFSQYGKPAEEDFSSLGTPIEKPVEHILPESIRKSSKTVINAASTVLSAPFGAAEAIAGGIVGMGEAAVAGIAGLGTAAAGFGFDKGFDATNKALEPLNELMQPETKVGEAGTKLLSKIPETIHAGGEKVFEATDSSLAGATTEAVGTLATLLLPKAISKIKLPTKEVITEAPTLEISPEVVKVATEIPKEEISPLAKQADDIVRTRVNNILASNRIVKNNTDVLIRDIPEKTSREAISEAIDRGKLDELPETERGMAQHAKSLFDNIGDRAVEAGVLDGMRENYISHIVDWSKVDSSQVSILKEKLLGNEYGAENVSSKSRFGKERKYSTFEDLQEAIKDTGLEIKTKDVAEIYKVYATSMERAIENKNMIESLKKVQEADGENIQWAIQKVSKDSHPPRGWEYINHSQMRGYVINPEIAPMMKFVFEGTKPGPIMDAALALTQATKRMNVIGSFFHAKSLIEAMYGNLGVLNAVSELGKMTADKIMNTKNAAINKSLETFKKGGIGDTVDKWIKEGGLIVEVPEDVSIGVIGQIGKAADEVLGKFGPKTTMGEKTLSKVEATTLGIFDKFTWDYLHTGLKLSVAERLLEKAKINHPEIPEATHRLEISRHLNNSFGGQNWFDTATQANTKVGREVAMSVYSPAGRRFLQLGLFAPDWTISTTRAFTTAFGKGTGAKGLFKPLTKADYARRYQLRTVFIYGTLINGMQQALTGRNLWDNNDPTRLEFSDGTSMQLMKHAAEPYHWLANPDKTMANKLGFLPRATMVGLGGLQYASPTAPKLIDLSGVGRTKAVMKTMLPFQIQAAVQAPEGEGLGRAIAGTLGFPTYGMTEKQRKANNKSTNKAKQDLAKEAKQRELKRKRGY